MSQSSAYMGDHLLTADTVSNLRPIVWDEEKLNKG